MTTPDLDEVLVGLLWIATTPGADGQPSRFEQAARMLRGVGSMRRAGVPEGLIADAFRPGLEETTALAAARRWAYHARERQPWEAASDPATVGPRSHGVLLLVGLVGAGKSAALAKLVEWRIAAGLWRARWVDCRGLVSTNWAKVNALDQLVEVPFLVLDDLSAAAVNRDGAREALVALLGQRHERRLSTGISSNLDKRAAEEAFGSAVWDRVQQDGEIVECSGSSLRERVDRVGLDATIVAADRLTQLVARLDRGPGWIGSEARPRVEVSAEVLEIPRAEAIRQLGRLLGLTGHKEALAAARVSREHAETEAGWVRELEAKATAKRVAKPLNLDAARRAHEVKVAELERRGAG